ncbi:aminopeptidase [candidate division KSB1 bacterium]|nr:aminopeptidase [candidate division KSB1 bacterium]
MTKKERAAHIIITKCLEVKKDESVLILATDPLLETAQILHQTILRRTQYPFLLHLSEQMVRNGLEKISRFMCDMNVIIAVTSPSISHTNARRDANKNGARIVSLPNILPATFARIADTDFKKNAQLSNKLCDILTIGKEVFVSAPNGTELYIPIKNKQGYSDTGLIHSPGQFSNLPAGEASIAPVDEHVSGKLVVDSGMERDSEDLEPLVLIIKNGRVARITGGLSAQSLRQKLSIYGPQARQVGEFGIGTNQYAKLCGYSLEDEKVLGTIHIGIGNNISFGGSNTVPIHLDGVVYQASVEIDGRKILENGRLVLN